MPHTVLITLGRLPKGLEFADGQSVLPALEGESTAEVSAEVVGRRRGRYELPLPVVCSSFPFGLSRWSWRGPFFVYLFAVPVLLLAARFIPEPNAIQGGASTAKPPLPAGELPAFSCHATT